MNAVLLGILVYIVVQLLVGVLVSRRIATEDDYLLAGRRLGYGLGTFTIFATWFGAETCIGSAGRMHEKGLAGGSADPFGYTLCLLLMALVFAIPLWRRQLTTLADLFRRRYSTGVERLAVLLMAPSSVMWAAAQIRAFGQVLSASSELAIEIAVTVAAAVVIIYTVSGGLLADAVTDLIQGIALVVGLVVLLAAVLPQLGGIAGAWQAIPPHRLRFFTGESPPIETLNSWAVPIFGSVIAQELVSRILACRSEKVAYRSCLAASGIYLAVGLIPAFVGLVGDQLAPGLTEHEQLLPHVAKLHLSTFLYILFAGALLSAILSTVDSALLVAASLVSHNLIVSLAPTMSDKSKVRVARLCVVTFGIVAYVLALHAEGIYELVERASAFGTAGLFVVIVFGLFTRWGGRHSAFATLLVGVVTWVTAEFVFESPISYLIALASAFVAYVLVSLFEQPPATAVVPAAVPEIAE